MNFKGITFFVLTLVLLVSACMPSPNLSSVGVSASGIPKSARHESDAEYLARIRNKPAYQGPIKLRIKTDLLQNTRQGRAIELTETLGSDFSIQNVPDGPLVFQEQWTKGQRPLEEVREFNLADTSQRYTLHVSRYTAAKQGQVEVNINGTDWIRFQDFSPRKSEIEKSGLLLNAHNRLRVRLQGQPGFTVQVSIVADGEAGTVLRRRGRLGLPGETQATHLRQNDTTIFDPNLSGSLGGLLPYTGHLGGAQSGVTAVSIDGTEPVLFEAGTLIVQLHDPEPH